jgi:hypothetical protein
MRQPGTLVSFSARADRERCKELKGFERKWKKLKVLSADSTEFSLLWANWASHFGLVGWVRMCDMGRKPCQVKRLAWRRLAPDSGWLPLMYDTFLVPPLSAGNPCG